MQLTKKLGLAVGALLSTTQVQAEDWLYNISVLHYSEKDSQNQDRVTVVEPVVSLTKRKAADDYVQLEFIYDSLTGASPNGANASSKVQIFNGYQVLPGFTPLDTSFNDERIAINYNWMKPLSSFSRYHADLNYSSESDYDSVAGSLSYLVDVDDKSTTLTIGGGYSYDTVNPHGGFHDAFTSIFATSGAQTTTSASGGGGSSSGSLFSGKDKQTFSALAGVAHVLNRFTLLDAKYSISQVNGYQTDPYKLISVIDSDGFPVDYVWENRPDSRLKQTVSTGFVTAIGVDSLHLDYRYYWDDWGIKANTYDVKYHLAVNSKVYVEPHYRLSNQQAADFYHLSLQQGTATPKNASADYRLADMKTTTLGGMIGYRFNTKLALTFNIEQIRQTGDNSPAQAVGDQKLNNMFPTLKMWALTFGIQGMW